MAQIAPPPSDLSDQVSMFWSVPRSERHGTAFFEFYPDSCANLGAIWKLPPVAAEATRSRATAPAFAPAPSSKA